MEESIEYVKAVGEASWAEMIAPAPEGMEFNDVEKASFMAGFSYGWVRRGDHDKTV